MSKYHWTVRECPQGGELLDLTWPADYDHYNEVKA